MQRLYSGFAGRPLHPRWKKMGERRLLVQRMRELGFEQMQRTRRVSTHRFYGRHNEQFKRHHGRNWISGQAEYGRVLTRPKNTRTAGANGNGVKEKLDVHLFQNLLDEIVFPY